MFFWVILVQGSIILQLVIRLQVLDHWNINRKLQFQEEGFSSSLFFHGIQTLQYTQLLEGFMYLIPLLVQNYGVTRVYEHELNYLHMNLSYYIFFRCIKEAILLANPLSEKSIITYLYTHPRSFCFMPSCSMLPKSMFFYFFGGCFLFASLFLQSVKLFTVVSHSLFICYLLLFSFGVVL